ncbi:hypothetical protein MTO96_047131, partial [Rhipicephalus appendiculatus]
MEHEREVRLMLQAYAERLKALKSNILSRLLPLEEDFNGVVVSLARPQDTYLLDMENLFAGHLTITSWPWCPAAFRSTASVICLPARECFYVGQVAVHDDRSVEWVESAMDKGVNEKPPSVPTDDLTKYLDLLIKK